MKKTYKAYLLSKGYSSKTAASHYRQLTYFLDWCEAQRVELTTITHGEILSYINHLQTRGIKQITVQHYLGSIKHYYHWQIKLGKQTDNPINHLNIQGIQRKSLHHIIPKPALEQLYNQSSETAIQQRNKIITGLLVYQGITSGELEKLTVQDVNLRAGTIYIAAGRRSNERELKLAAHQILEIMEYLQQARTELLAQTNKQTEQLIISTGQSHYTRSILTKLMNQLHQQNPSVTSYKQIRASVITHWLKVHNLRKVQYMAGHKYVSSTEAYLINDLEGLSEDISKFHPIS